MTIILDGTTGITTPAINSSGDFELPGGTTNGVLYLNGSKVATSGSALTYDGTTFKADAAAVFNDSGADVDFRVESDTVENALFVQGSDGFVGIGTNAPAGKLELDEPTDNNLSFFLRARGGNAKIALMRFFTNDSGGVNAGGTVWHDGSSLNLNSGTSVSAPGMSILPSGSVGIGTSSPAGILHLQKSSGGNVELRMTETAGGTSYGASIDAFNSSGGNLRIRLNDSGGTLQERFRITAAGDVGIGTSSPSSKLHVQSTITVGNAGFTDGRINSADSLLLYIDSDNDDGNDNNYFAWGKDSATSTGTELMRLKATGDLLVGTTTSQAKLTVDGYLSHKGTYGRQGTGGALGQGNLINFFWTGAAQLEAWVDTSNVGNVTLSSDYRIKKNVVTQTENALERIVRLRPIVYELADYGELFKADGVRREGFIAHEVQEVIPSGAEGQKDEENRIQNLRVDAILAVAVKAIQELKAELDAAKEKIAALEAK